MSESSDLRRHYRNRRAQLAGDERVRAVARIVEFIAPWFTADEIIGAFIANDGEPDLGALFDIARDAAATIALPIVGADSSMQFHEYTTSERLVTNRYGISEPLHDPVVPAARMTRVLVPLVAFDDRGCRLGMGKGYYDRYLGALLTHPPLIGVAFECQRHPQPLPQAAHDVPLDGVVTEAGLRMFRGSNPAMNET